MEIMNTDTPETDAAARGGPSQGYEIVHTDFARKLERERDEARAELEAWQSENGPEGWWVKHEDYIEQKQLWENAVATLKRERDEWKEARSES
jgi:hypothetical protein